VEHLSVKVGDPSCVVFETSCGKQADKRR